MFKANSNLKIVLLLILLVVTLAFALTLFPSFKAPKSQQVSNFDECIKAGNLILESYPRQCVDKRGNNFTEVSPPTFQNGQPISVQGEITCLPKVGSGPQTMECAIGLQSSDGRYYGLKNLAEIDPDYTYSIGGIAVEVSGTFLKDEHSGPDGNKYKTVGSILIESIRKTNESLTEVPVDDTTSQRLKAIESEYPEFTDFENQESFAGHTLKLQPEQTDLYVAYIVHGSGLPIAEATCFRVDRMMRVYKVGEFPDPLDSMAGYDDIDATDCSGIVSMQ
jgi:hypothetical protein